MYNQIKWKRHSSLIETSNHMILMLGFKWTMDETVNALAMKLKNNITLNEKRKHICINYNIHHLRATYTESLFVQSKLDTE